ncbi:MAG: 30S ribosomal protein S27ae [Acidilobaceae archaeon]
MAKELKTYIHKLYVIDMEKGVARLKNKRCPRCGSIMAYHTQGGERWHCGKCGYTEFIVKAAPAPLRERRPEKEKKKK